MTTPDPSLCNEFSCYSENGVESWTQCAAPMGHEPGQHDYQPVASGPVGVV